MEETNCTVDSRPTEAGGRDVRYIEAEVCGVQVGEAKFGSDLRQYML